MLFPLEEIAPLGGIDGRLLVERVMERYIFRIGPDSNVPKQEIDKTGLKFESGQFGFNGERVNINDFTAYSDGIVATANTTERSEAFLDDIVKWLRIENGFRDFLSEPRRFFLSSIVIEFEGPLSHLLPSYQKIADSISKHLTTIYHADVPIGLARIDFEFDKSGESAGLSVPRIMLERRPGIPFKRERYFCGAPMKTAQHIEILEGIERDLA